MIVNVIDQNKWILATDGTKTSGVQLLDCCNQFTTSFPYIFLADTIADLLAKVYTDAALYEDQYDEDGELIEAPELTEGYDINSFTLKSTDDLALVAEDNAALNTGYDDWKEAQRLAAIRVDPNPDAPVPPTPEGWI